MIAAADAAGMIREASGIAEAPDGTVYVVDGPANRVQRFAPDGAVIDVWGDLGTAPGLFDGPAGIAVAPDGSVFVADTGNDRVQRFDAHGQFLGQLEGPPGRTDALDGPVGVAVAADGSIYVSDPGHDRVLRFGPDRRFLGAFGSEGTDDERLDEPRQVAVGPDGTVYVVDFRHDRVVRYSPDGTRLGHFRTSSPYLPEAENRWLNALAVGADGTVYANQSVYAVYHFTADGTETGQFQIGIAGELVALAAPGTGRLLVGVERHEEWDPVSRRDVEAPLVIAEFDASDRPPYRYIFLTADTRRIGHRAPGDAPGQFEARTGYYPPRLALSAAPDGTLFVADYRLRRVQWFRSDGLWLGMREGFAEGLFAPGMDGLGIAAGPDGSYWVADPVRGALVHLDRAGAELGTLPMRLPVPLERAGLAHAVAVAPDGSLFAANTAWGVVAHLDVAGTQLASWGEEPDGSDADFGGCSDSDIYSAPCNSQALALSPEGDVVYRLDSSNGRVQSFTPDGAPLANWPGLGATGNIHETAQGIAVGPDGSLYASDTPNRRVVRWGPDGLVDAVLDGTRAARGLRAAFDRPGGLAVSPDGTLFIADREGGRVLAFGDPPRHDWRGEYFGNPWLAERPLVISHTAEIDMDWGEAAPASELPADGWSARFERTFRLTGGEYGFMGEGEGGIRAWVGDKLVVDEWNPAPGSWRRWYGFVLPEDADVAVRLEFKDTGGAASLSWSLVHGPPSTMTPSASPTGSVPSTPTPAGTPSEGARPIDRVFVPFAGR